MTVNEVETILETLYVRHPALDEAMLITLLTAGGWEEKNIRDAVVLFRAAHRSGQRSAAQTLFVPPAENRMLPQAVDIAHTLTEHTESSQDSKPAIVLPADEDLSENRSPLVPSETILEESPKEPGVESANQETAVNPVEVKEDAIPENLPLRPFESNSHVWPFSMYKDVFHSASEPLLAPEVSEEEKGGHLSEKNSGPRHFSRKEDTLTLLAEIMLGIILLILAYMYSNGRL